MKKECILTTAQMIQADQLAIAELKEQGRSGADLMEAAGLSVTREILKNCSGNKALILCGPGNNGGDGFVIARHLQDASWKVTVALLGSLESLQGDAYYMAKLWNGEILPLNEARITDQDVIIDAIFGTGLSKELSGKVRETVDKVNLTNSLKVAVDIPSGIKGDTGEILGSAIKADFTVTFCRMKPAHILFPSKKYCGQIIVTDIGISDRIVQQVEPGLFINSPECWIDKMPDFELDSHKYNKGHAVVISGDLTQTGACRLAAMAALRSGAGLVSVSSPENALMAHASHLTSVMIRRRENLVTDLKDHRLNTWCIGPAAGLTKQTRNDVLSILESGKNTVLDADALTVFEDDPRVLFEAIKAISGRQCVLTPHAGEFARIFPYLKKLDKITAALSAATLSGAVIIYKGADTVVASPEGQVIISNDAPATLATAGSGDVLSGIVTGLMAQNMNAFDAACASVWLHGQCANEYGRGLISEDMEKLIPAVLKALDHKFSG
ncbi:MAG: NAD(P)H-hydrate dehydratase [Alphaproteobacteria bacterium]|nr:NAD(P)H-hydrate dehydratase [Alphaproteobacteria bacterium]